MTAHFNNSDVKTTKATGDAAEDVALHYLQAQGLKLLERNYRTPGRGGGEIDLIMRDKEGVSYMVVRRPASVPPNKNALCLPPGFT